MRIAILGCGKIGEAVLTGLLNAKLTDLRSITATTRHPATAHALEQRTGVKVLNDNRAAVKGAAVILLGTKPKQCAEVCREVSKALPRDALFISLATGVSTSLIEQMLPASQPVLRAMPNTPVVIGRGMTVLCRGTRATEQHLANATRLFASVGEVAVVEEELMDAVTGLSASGPAYIYVIIESLAEAGVKVGLPRELATQLAAHTVLGSASMVLATGMHPALLKDSVTTPAGVTIDGLMELEDGGLRVTLIKAIVMCTRRATEIQEKLTKTWVLPKPKGTRL